MTLTPATLPTRRELRARMRPDDIEMLNSETAADVDSHTESVPSQNITDLTEPNHEDEEVDVVPEELGWGLNRSGWRRWVRVYPQAEDGASSTTRQLQILNTALIAAPTDEEGTLNGRDRISRTSVFHERMSAYRKGQVDSINSCTSGAVGAGKSTSEKLTEIGRPVLLDRQAFIVIDKKPENGVGEFTELTLAAGSTPIVFALGEEGSRLNPLDMSILGMTTESGGAIGEAKQRGVLRAAAELMQDGKKLTKFEMGALRGAHREALRAAEADRGREPVITDVIDALGKARIPEFAHLEKRARSRMHEAGIGLQSLFLMLVDEYPGLFDGETSKDVNLGKKLTTFDISQITNGPAVSIIMLLIQSWTIARLTDMGTRIPTTQVLSEGWWVGGGPAGEVFRSNLKLSRGLGLATAVDFHHISDFKADDPAVGFMKEAGIVRVFRQDRKEDAMAAESTFGFQKGTWRQLMTLPNGTHYLKIGTNPEILVDGVRSDYEIGISSTNGAIGERDIV